MARKPISDSWERGSPYERYIGRWSRRVAPQFLAWLDAPSGRRWLDVGCGTGALSAAILDHCAPSAVVGVEPSEGFRQLAASSLGTRATLLPGDAAALPLDDAAVDITVCALVLNFVPDLRAGLAEMVRVTAPDGILAAYVWDYAQGMEPIRLFWDAAVALDPAAAQLHEGRRFPLCNPAALKAAFVAAGLAEVAVTAIDTSARFDDFDDYWLPFLGGQGPAPAYAMSLPEGDRVRLRESLREGLAIAADGSLTLMARGWAVRGTKAAAGPAV
jgi:SAM-dependent methyltransferase